VKEDFTADIAAIAASPAVPTILDVVCRVTGMRYAAVARVTKERWICLASKDGLNFGLNPGGELPIETTICREVHQACSAVVIDHVAENATFRDHPTPALYKFQSYISVPILLSDGTFYGTLCAIDPAPAKLEALGAADLFRLFADIISKHVETTLRATHAEAKLTDATTTADLREKFIAVLGHDLRNPLGAISAGSELLALMLKEDDSRARSVVDKMRRSVVRMTRLIDDVTDFARGSLGDGMSIDRTKEALEPVIRHVVDELRSTHPDRAIEVDIALDSRDVFVDKDRIAQMLSNLLGNALRYGSKDAPIKVHVRSSKNSFELSVTNGGPEIPTDILPRLFAPFTRGAHRNHEQGLGLGLFIVSEIARAHGGSIEVSSKDASTRFTFRMPMAA